MSLEVRTVVILVLALAIAALVALAFAVVWRKRAQSWQDLAKRCVRQWTERSTKLERAMAERPLMDGVLSTLPRCEEAHPLAGVIVELRCHPNLAAVVGKVRNIVPGLPIRIFHGNLNRAFVEQAFPAEIAAGAIRLVNLRIDELNLERYNWLMTGARFYEACDARHILVFQTDSVLFARSRVKLEEFVRYDYVGARWQIGGEWVFRRWSMRALPPIAEVGNGGLSLRRRSRMIEAAKAVPYLSVPFLNEDVHFAFALRQIGAELPPVEVCDRFSFEEVLGDELPFGAHKFMPPRFHDQILPDERSILREPQP